MYYQGVTYNYYGKKIKIKIKIIIITMVTRTVPWHTSNIQYYIRSDVLL